MSSTPASLLQLKLRPPQASGPFVSRPMLLERLDRSLDVALTVIIAPAGFGKTSLMTEWLDMRQQAAGWVSLDRKDSDISRFTAYFVAAMRTVYPQAGTASQALLNAFTPLSPTNVAEALLQDLAALPGSLVIVLDDYYRAETPETNELLRYLLHIPPPNLHLILTTRADPALPLGRLRSRFQLVEIRTKDLRFSLAEATRLLNLLADRLVDDDDVVRLQEQTEGWAVGLQLAGVILQRGLIQPDDFVTELSTHSQQWVMEYLADEVLASISQELRAILFQLAIFDRFCAPLLETVLTPQVSPGRGRGIIDYLEDANLFLIPLDNARTWFRFHHLFRAFLQRNLTATWAPEDISRLHLKASGWFETHGLIDDAVEHALSAGADERAVYLIESNIYRVLNEEDLRHLDWWLSSTPKAMETRPAILVAKAYRQQWRHQLDSLPPLLEQAEAGLTDASTAYTPEERAHWQGAIASLRAVCSANDGNSTLTFEQCRLALRLTPPDWRFVRGLTELSYSMALRTDGKIGEAIAFCNQRLVESGTSIDSRTLRLYLALCICHYENADAHELLATAGTYLSVAAKLERPISIGWARFFAGWAHYQRNELDAAEEDFRHLVANRNTIHMYPLVGGYTGLALTLAAKGKIEDAYGSVQEFAGFLTEIQTLSALPVAESLIVRLRLLEGKEPGAALPGNARHQYRNQWWEMPVLTAVRTDIAVRSAGDLDRAGDLLRICREHVQQLRIRRQQIDFEIVSAQYHAAQGNAEAALEELGRAVAGAQAGGIIRMFVDAGPALLSYLQLLESRVDEQFHVRRILAAYEAGRPPALSPFSSSASRDANGKMDIELAALLSFREREVLELITHQLTNAEIADQLTISVSTVKRHTHSIFRKLEVSNRRQAAAKAVRLGLASPTPNTPSH